MKLLSTLTIIFGIMFQVSAQENLKIGHVNIPEIIQKMPERDSLEAVLKKEADEMQEVFDEMLNLYETEVEEYENEKSGYSDFIKETKETELLELSDKIQQYQQNASLELQNGSSELYQPVYNKIDAAIKSVATRESFTYILDISNGVVAYKAPDSFDINPLVFKELGL